MTILQGDRSSVYDQQRLVDELLLRLERGDFKLPLLPEVARQVSTLALDCDSDAARLAALIHRDQALAGHVLRVANSASFAGLVRIVSLQQAVARLGMRLLREVALTASLHSGIFKVPGSRALVDGYWRHSFSTGLYAREIARIRRHNLEAAFLCGLLHEIGKPIVLHALMEHARTRALQVDESTRVSVVEALYVPFGVAVAKAWSLPPRVANVIEFTTRPNEAPSSPDDVGTVILANLLARLAIGADGAEVAEIEQHPVLESLHLYPDDVTELIEKREDVLQALESMHA